MPRKTVIMVTLSYLFLATPALAAAAYASDDASLHTAAMAALEYVPGQVLEADRERGEKTYEIDIVHDNQITEVDVDAATGKVVKAETGTDKIKHRIKKFLISDKTFAALKNAKVSLPDAIVIAEKATQAKAVAAEFEHEDGKYVYEIKLKADAKYTKVRVDANSGEVQSRKR